MEPQNKELHRVVPTAIIHYNGKYLILKRSLRKKVFPGKWQVPGGGMTIDDYVNSPTSVANQWYYSVVKTLRREIKEETGLEVSKLNYLLDLTFIRPDGIPVVTLSYYGDWKSGDVKLNEEGTDYKWVTAKEAKEYDLISGVLEEIEMTDKILKGEDPKEIQFNN